jgi:hypothetical protein
VYERYDSERSAYTIEWIGKHDESITHPILMVIAHALKSKYENVTLTYGHKRCSAHLIATHDGDVVAHVDMRLT